MHAGAPGRRRPPRSTSVQRKRCSAPPMAQTPGAPLSLPPQAAATPLRARGLYALCQPHAGSHELPHSDLGFKGPHAARMCRDPRFAWTRPWDLARPKTPLHSQGRPQTSAGPSDAMQAPAFAARGAGPSQPQARPSLEHLHASMHSPCALSISADVLAAPESWCAGRRCTPVQVSLSSPDHSWYRVWVSELCCCTGVWARRAERAAARHRLGKA